MKYRARFILFLLFVLLGESLLLLPMDSARAVRQTFPRRANFFLSLQMTENDIAKLAAWDVVVLNMDQQLLHPEYLRELRRRNPEITILAHVSTQEVVRGLASAEGYMPLRYKLWRGIQPAWYLQSPEGAILSWWPETYLLNVTADCPRVNGDTWQTYLAKFVADEMLSTGLWDGIFYDNTWDNITYFAGPRIDLNGDRLADADLDRKWQTGMTKLFQETRARVGHEIYLVGNNDTQAYGAELNGLLIENFSINRWEHQIERYAFNEDVRRVPRLNIINANTENRGSLQSYREMRFGLTSALMENGYYSFDFGDQNHGQLWWYDEYDVDLGEPVSEAVSPSGARPYTPAVWQREFRNGLSLVNSTEEARTVTLPNEYEKITGAQDPATNDGAIISELLLPPRDGLVLLKVIETLVDVLYRNGSFARFLRSDGTRVRNGFFVFQENKKGGDIIGDIDIDDNGKRDSVVGSGSRLTLWRDDGELYMEVFPYTANYTGELRIAIGDVDADGKDDIIVAPSIGKHPIKMYSRYGEIIRDTWFPFGTAYSGGMSVAIGNVDKTPEKEIIIGAGSGRRPTVGVYDIAGKRQQEWLAFEQQFRGGVSVSAGDMTGDGMDEIAVAAGKGKTPLIRVFTFQGKKIGKDIIPYTTTDRSGLDVQIEDVNFDGQKDIIALSRGVGL